MFLISIKPLPLMLIFIKNTWWRHQMETFSAFLAICAGNSAVPGEFLAERPVTRSFDVFFDLHLNKRLSKHSWGWWFETLLRPLWCHCNVSGKVLFINCNGLWILPIYIPAAFQCIHLDLHIQTSWWTKMQLNKKKRFLFNSHGLISGKCTDNFPAAP